MMNDLLFNTLWQQYYQSNPGVKRVYDLFLEREGEIINDHIALRTFDLPTINIDVLAKPFIDLGYKEANQYDFPVKKLFAKHYEHPDETQPKVFISQLLTQAFSPFLQDTVKEIVTHIPTALRHDPTSLLTSGISWRPIYYTTYKKLLAESEYAAWVYAFGFRANHFTVSVNHLKTFKGLVAVNDFLKKTGFKLNDAGGEIKGTPQELLEQSSIMAIPVPVEFAEGTYEIPLSYYEFALRYPMENGRLYSGFVAASADKLFQSTDVGHSSKT
jgi:hypothetical protein